MDDYTWNKKVRARRRRVKLERVFFLLLLIFGISFAIWNHTSRTKTPAYAINEIVTALNSGDTETFNRRVDLTSIITRAYDDLTGDMFKNDDQISMSERLLFENFYVLIRPQMCAGAVKVINTKIATDNWTLPEEILKGRQLGIDFDLLLERSLIRHTKFVAVENIQHLGEKATADVKVVEETTNTPFTFKITLENFSKASWQVGSDNFEIFGETWQFPGLSFTLDDNSWKITSVENYKEYLETVTPIIQTALENYIDATAEIVDGYNYLFAIEQSNFIVMQRTSDGLMNYSQRERIANYITGTIIPTLNDRQSELDAVEIPHGAEYLANLRAESTKVTIAAWKSYAQALVDNDSVKFERAESLHKQELALDQRIDEVVKNSAVARNLPELP